MLLMEAESAFETIVILLIGAIVLLTILGESPSLLIEIAPQIIIFALVLAVAIAILRGVVG